MRATLLVSALIPFVLVPALACGGGGGSTGPTTPASTLTSGESTVPKAPDHPESDKVTWKKDAPAKDCHTSSKGGGDLSAGAMSMAKGCVDTGKMKQVGTTTTGQGQASGANMVKAIPLAAKANHCYRIFGLADASITDFDIAVIDSAGKSAGEDLNDSNEAIVLEDGSICFKEDDNANVNAAVATGSGNWAVVIFGD
jgi:hypothetical protein